MTQQNNLALKDNWVGFDLEKIGTQVPTTTRCGDVVIASGCITTINPTKAPAGWDVDLAWADATCSPREPFLHLAPTMMSRYEGIYQCGTTTTLWPTGKLTTRFSKTMVPMVLHLSGMCWHTSKEEPVEIQLKRHEATEWGQQGARVRRDVESFPVPKESEKLEPNPDRPPSVTVVGGIVFLSGEFKTAQYGSMAQIIGNLPEGTRPRRELRWLAKLVEEVPDTDSLLIEHSVALTLRPDGTISVQGGKVHSPDNRGNMRILQQKKKGRLYLDGIRFGTFDGVPVEPRPAIAGRRTTSRAEKSKISYLVSTKRNSDEREPPQAACLKQGSLILLEGCLVWTPSATFSHKQPIAQLPSGCWPRFRQVFFTRGGNDLEERRRVDIDQYGRVFCPEGASDGRLELTGVVFVAADRNEAKSPKDPDWDELKLHYERTAANNVTTSFDGHDLLEQFIARCNWREWNYLEFDIARHASRKMLLPRGEVKLRGSEKYNKPNLARQDERVFNEIQESLKKHFQIGNFRTLLYVTNKKFEEICNKCSIHGYAKELLLTRRQENYRLWLAQREEMWSYEYLDALADQIVDQMFEHWDFRAQVQGALNNDFRAPQSIEHLFGKKQGKAHDRLIKERIAQEDMPKFEEIRQFFFLYETTGNTMTHCSLMGAQDVFSSTGKWHFPDSRPVQKQLFDNIAWLFPRKMYLYMSERQTARFPFIEDLDIQARRDWQQWTETNREHPPDELIMNKPKRKANGEVYGEPGELMCRRAQAIHMIYPHVEELRCLVYSASGLNKGKGMLKSSFHLVWPQLIVDADRAPVIRHVTLGVFAAETKKRGSHLAAVQQKLMELHDTNIWELVFDQTTINARNGLRLPYSDKASMVVREEDKERIARGEISQTKAFKQRVVENRPSKAIGELVFTFPKDNDAAGSEMQLPIGRWIADEESRPISEWIAGGTCRRDANDLPDLTPWYLGQEVLQMLPTRAGETFNDGNGGMVTHRPIENIRRCVPPLTVKEFTVMFSDALLKEQEFLQDEGRLNVLRQLVGCWTHLTETQAVWRTTSSSQTSPAANGIVPDFTWGTERRQMINPTEVMYLASKGKIIVSGPKEPVDVLVSALSRKNLTQEDDNAIMPIYDVSQM